MTPTPTPPEAEPRRVGAKTLDKAQIKYTCPDCEGPLFVTSNYVCADCKNKEPRRVTLLGERALVPNPKVDARFRVSKKFGVEFWVFGYTHRCNHGIELNNLSKSHLRDAESRWLASAACEAAIVHFERKAQSIDPLIDCLSPGSNFEENMAEHDTWLRILEKVEAIGR